jgi:hypothetical protein
VPEGRTVTLQVRRGEAILNLEMPLRLSDHVSRELREVPHPTAKAERIRRGLLTGHRGQASQSQP